MDLYLFTLYSQVHLYILNGIEIYCLIWLIHFIKLQDVYVLYSGNKILAFQKLLYIIALWIKNVQQLIYLYMWLLIRTYNCHIILIKAVDHVNFHKILFSPKILNKIPIFCSIFLKYPLTLFYPKVFIFFVLCVFCSSPVKFPPL